MGSGTVLPTMGDRYTLVFMMMTIIIITPVTASIPHSRPWLYPGTSLKAQREEEKERDPF